VERSSLSGGDELAQVIGAPRVLPRQLLLEQIG